MQEVTSQSREMHQASAWTDGAAVGAVALAETVQATSLRVTFMNRQKFGTV